MYENLDTQAFKNLDTKIKDNFSASAANNLTPPWCGHLNHLNFHAVKVWLHGCEVNKIILCLKFYTKMERVGLLIADLGNIEEM